MLEAIAVSAVTVLIGGLMTYVIVKKSVNPNVILEFSDILLDEIATNTDMQKKVYILGVLLGNGIKSGIGLQKGKGKFSMEDLIGYGLSMIFGKQGQTPGSNSSSSGDQNPFKLPL